MNNQKMNKNKKSQSEVITTVILILVGIAAVALVSTFVISMVRDNLKGSECFDATGQVNIDVNGGWTYYNYSGTLLFLNVARGNKDFNLTGILVSFGDGMNTKSVKITSGLITGIYPAANILTSPSSSNTLALPGLGETYTYAINISNVSTFTGNITSVSLAPILMNGIQCAESDKASVPLK